MKQHQIFSLKWRQISKKSLICWEKMRIMRMGWLLILTRLAVTFKTSLLQRIGLNKVRFHTVTINLKKKINGSLRKNKRSSQVLMKRNHNKN